jgi:hypothetical protein
MRDPGLDRHLWESEWQQLEPLVVDSPAEALPELDRLLASMLAEEGYPLEEDGTSAPAERVAEEGIEPEVLAGFRAAHEITLQVERGADVDPAEVGQAVGVFRGLYEHLVSRQADLG